MGGHVRISVISNASTPPPGPSSFFSYSSQFKYRWTDEYLSSTGKSVTGGQPQTFTVDGTSFTVKIPSAGEGARGIIIADPCFHGAAAGCTYGDKFNTFERMTALLNAAGSSMDYWQILGDNFYDREGTLSQAWFDQLNLDVKSTLFSTVAGNHDYWAFGDPLVSVKGDQFGNGHMQFYGMDPVSSNAGADFLNFSVDPDKAGILGSKLPAIENSFSYYSIGNVGFITFSGAYSFDDSSPLFKDGCSWLSSADHIEAAFIVGHWNDAGLGCSKTMDVPDVWNEIKGYPGCDKLSNANRLKYIMGHTHCNKVTQENVGFMVAGQGMEGCGNFGVPVVDSTNGMLNIWYFPIADKQGTDNYNSTLSCFMAHGIDGCYHLAESWLNQSLVQ